ncbi:MAG: ABC-three component system protein [Acidobacteriota bacterium]
MALFHSAKTEDEAKAALDRARDVLWGAPPKYPQKKNLSETIAPYVNHVLDLSSENTVAIIQRFQLSVAAIDPLRDLRPRVKAKWVRPESVELVIKHAHGWIKEKLDGLLLEGKAAVLDVDEFNAEISAYLPRVDFRQILTAIAGRLELTDDTIAAEQLRTYVRQLELIEYSEEDVMEAINNFLRASAERSAWSEAGIVHDDSFDEYEASLTTYWKNKRAVQRVIHKSLSCVERGQLLLADCALHQQKLQGLEVPAFFTPGSFHALAEEKTVGWHPDYEALLPAGGQDGNSK